MGQSVKQVSGSGMSSSDRKKLIAVCAVLVLAVAWIAAWMLSGGEKSPVMTEDERTQAKAAHDDELTKVKQQEKKLLVNSGPPIGS